MFTDKWHPASNRVPRGLFLASMHPIYLNGRGISDVDGRRGAVLILLALLPGLVKAQALTNAPDPSFDPVYVNSQVSSFEYKPPTESAKWHDALLDSIGPYPLTMALLTAGVHQATDNPPDWHQGLAAFGERFGSNMGITLVDNATRYGLGEILKADTSYHRCRCKGFLARLGHATVSTVIARNSEDGHSVFSVPGIAAPYVATAVAVYGWYPSRYGIEDALRMGNYNLLGYVASNLTYEFIPTKAGALLGRFHLASRRAGSMDGNL